MRIRSLSSGGGGGGGGGKKSSTPGEISAEAVKEEKRDEKRSFEDSEPALPTFSSENCSS
jgi:hypothetical protein